MNITIRRETPRILIKSPVANAAPRIVVSGYPKRITVKRDGLTGPQGPQGLTGQNGADGTNGITTVITPETITGGSF